MTGLDRDAFREAYWQEHSTAFIRRVHPEYRKRSDERADALLARILAASPAVPDGLDEAWKAAETALPEGWVLESDRWPDGECRAKAWQYAKPWAKAIEARGPTPAAALRALAARLTPQEPESRPEEGPR